MRLRARGPLAALAIAVLPVAACGGDDDGTATPATADPARTEAFCEDVAALQASEEGLDLSDPSGLARFEQLVAGAPAGVRDDLEYFVDQTERFGDLDEDDPSSVGEAFGLFFDPEFIDAIRGFGTFLRDECGIDVPGLAELEDFDPDQLQQDLSDLDGELDELQDELDRLEEAPPGDTSGG